MKKSTVVPFILVIAAAVTILAYFGIGPIRDESIPPVEETSISTVAQSGGVAAENIEENITVTSHNQSGGITAGKISLGKESRKMTAASGAQLLKLLPKDKDTVISIDAVWGDQEAFQFAESIKAYLQSQGRKVNGVDQVAYNKPLLGQSVSEDGTRIRVGGGE